MITALIALGTALVAGLFVWIYLSGKNSRTEERARLRDEELTRSTAELADFRQRHEKATTELAALHATLASERLAGEQRLQVLREAHDTLKTEFKGLSAEALKSNNTSFLELARTALERAQAEAKGDLDKRSQAIDLMVKPLKESLEKVDAKIGEIEKSRERAYTQLGSQLEQLNVAQVRLQTEATKLSTALRSTTYSGSWGELQLRRVVEMAEMLPYCDFAEQESAGALRADLVIRLPGGQRIVVDAKAPVQSFREALESADEISRSRLLSEHAVKVRSHIDSLGAKSYWESFQPAPEFVVLFLPGDHLLSAALQSDASLLDRALSRKVLLATPTTLIALLKAAAYGWRQEAVSKNAEDVSKLGRELYDRITTFADHLEKVGKGLENAVKGYNSAVGSFESGLLSGGRRFAELGAKGTKELGQVDAVETGIREIARRA